MPTATAASAIRTQQDCIICNSNQDCAAFPGLNCVQGWSVRDFQVTLTSGQPIGFLASQGLRPVPCDPDLDRVCGGGSAAGSVAQVQEDPFRGELKCVQVDADDVPVLRSDLKIEATIVRTTVPAVPPPPVPVPGVTTAAAYNGIGFGTVSLGTEDNDDPLCLGSLPTGSTDLCAATYAPCPGTLILDHFFEGAEPEFGGIVNTDLTLVPCSENLGDPDVSGNFEVVAQMLIYNEFEQRFSTSTRVQCYRATTLGTSTPPMPPTRSRSSPSGVQGTLTGQTRIRGVQTSDGNLGYGLLGVACENYREIPQRADPRHDRFQPASQRRSACRATRCTGRPSHPRYRESRQLICRSIEAGVSDTPAFFFPGGSAKPEPGSGQVGEATMARSGFSWSRTTWTIAGSWSTG